MMVTRFLHRKLHNASRRLFSSITEPFAELDTVVLRRLTQFQTPTLTRPLRQRGQTKTRNGDKVSHDTLLGLRSWDAIKTRRGAMMQAHHPSLEEYVELTPRLVTPVYPNYAALITSLLDLHPSASVDNKDGDQTFEILEAGTGHGGLTLYLARALVAGNLPLPPDVHSELQRFREESLDTAEIMPMLNTSKYKASRGAVLHTLDVSEKHSSHAQRIVAGFARGIYYPTVDFHVGNLSNFLDARINAQATPFTHMILDLPSPEKELPKVVKTLRSCGTIIVFAPSITQLGECLRSVREQGVPLVLERALEVGMGLAGGREWDLREVMIRAKEKEETMMKEGGEKEVENEGETEHLEKLGTWGEGESEKVDLEKGSRADTNSITMANANTSKSEPVMVCRPKVGLRISGGGFIGLWRKIEPLAKDS